MLNINAKSFLPQSALVQLAPPTNALYRYHLMLPEHRVCDISPEVSGSNNLQSLLANRWLRSSSQGGLGEEPLQIFLSSFFDAVENIPLSSRGLNVFSGILFSRSILSLSIAMASINAINEAPGFLIRVDIPREYHAEIALKLRAAWDDFFECIRGDLRALTFGYVGSSSGAGSGKRYNGKFCHYFFLSSTSCSNSHSSEGLNVDYLKRFPFPFLRIVQVNAILPFICNPKKAVAVVISVGDTAKEKLLSDGGKITKTFSIVFNRFDVSETSKSLNQLENLFLLFLQDNSNTWDRSNIVHIDIQLDSSKPSEEIRPIPIWDMIQFIGNLCDDTATSVLGVCFSEDTIEEGIQIESLNSEGRICYLNATLQTVLEEDNSLDIYSACFGQIPAYIKKPMTTNQYEYARKLLGKWLKIDNEPIPLTRMVFADAADSFAKVKYYVRNRTIGEKNLLMTDSRGDIFAADLRTGSLFALPKCFGGIVNPIRNTIFEAVITSSRRGYLDCMIIIEDILVFEGKEVNRMGFSERWNYVEKTVLDTYCSWPHTNTDGIVIVRTCYTSFDQTEQVFKNPPLEHPSLGLVFVPQHGENENKPALSYSWIPPESIIARFFTGKIEDVPDTNQEIKRAWLQVRNKEGKMISYNDEYADYSFDGHRLLETGSIIDCLLRRSDGAHWWELIKDYDKNQGKIPYSYVIVEKLVHVPGLTYEEMLWLLKAHFFKCGRCQTVSDIGKTNPKCQTYWCQGCWEETGHGECLYCGRPCSMGKIDTFSKHFYCDGCWEIFSSTNTNAEIGYMVPPPPNTSFPIQVLTRCVSLLIDIINPKAPTNDVLELCCGGAVIRKWIKNKTACYVGLDLKTSVVERTKELISSSHDDILDMSSYNVICADSFSRDLWSQHIKKIHPRQFHIITVFAGFHHAFDTESQIRHVVGSIVHTLVPHGVFLGCFFDVSILYEKEENTNDLFTVEWDEDFRPRNGHHFYFSMQGKAKKRINVVTIDFLVAIAQEYGLRVIPEVCSTFFDILDNDPNFTKKFSKGEKDYLTAMRTFAFQKDGNPQLRVSRNVNGNNERG